MFKFIIFTIIGFYILFKIIGFLFRILINTVGSETPRTFTYQSTQQKKPAPNSNVNIDFIPDKPKNKKDFKGGEYVDYEEIK